MILELDDGREIKLDDTVDDETARMIKRLVQAVEAKTKRQTDGSAASLGKLVAALEEGTRAANASSVALREEVAALAKQVAALAGAKGEKHDDSGMRKELANLGAAINKMAAMKHDKGPEKNDDGQMAAAMAAGFKRLEKIALAPTKWVYDATGEIVGGKKDV